MEKMTKELFALVAQSMPRPFVVGVNLLGVSPANTTEALVDVVLKTQQSEAVPIQAVVSREGIESLRVLVREYDAEQLRLSSQPRH